MDRKGKKQAKTRITGRTGRKPGPAALKDDELRAAAGGRKSGGTSGGTKKPQEYLVYTMKETFIT